MNMARLIERKRDAGTLTGPELEWMIGAYVRGDVPDYQMAAFAMAVLFRGLDSDELTALTAAMLDSGERFGLADWPRPRVDKHSIGGVGDKTSLLLAPMLACLDVTVPMISGRGLGHTGGTLDKLEAIPGFRTDLTLAAARAQLARLGVVMVGQTEELVPADRKLYALRDVTGTVESIPLISASIMSKKLAEDLTGLVLDIKSGSGAFITDPARSIELARTMIDLGEARGCRTVGLITAMDRPLGIACGNALEVIEALDALEGRGPPDLMAVTFALGTEMLLAAGVESDPSQARTRVEATIGSGAARERLSRLVEAQGGNPVALDDRTLLPRAPVVEAVRSDEVGVVTSVEPRVIGHAIVDLGGGRRQATDPVDPSVGIRVMVAPGDAVGRGDMLAEVHGASQNDVARASRAVKEAFVIGGTLAPLPLLSHRITPAGVERLSSPSLA